jgi:hypothetical protein
VVDNRRAGRANETGDALRAGRDRAARLFAWLDDIGRYGGGPAMLRPAWARLAELLENLARAQQASSGQSRQARKVAQDSG